MNEANIIPDAKTISIVMPTRKRPRDLNRLVSSIINTATHLENIEVCICVDHDDMESAIALIALSDRVNIKVCIVSKQQCHGEYWNSAWRQATGDVIQMSSDDFIYRTRGWDIEVLKEINKFEDKMVMVYGEDGFQHGKLATHAFIHRRWTDALGEFVQMHTNVFYHDTWIDVLSTRIGRRCYREDLYFEHMHPAARKSTEDDTHRQARTKSGGDIAKWDANWQGEAMQKDHNKLKELFYE